MQVFYSADQLQHRLSIFEYGLEYHFEVPERMLSIVKALEAEPKLFQIRGPESYGLEALEQVHGKDYLHYLQHLWTAWKEEKPQPQAVAETFFVRGLARRRPANLVACMGYYCFDRFTPIIHNTWTVARLAANCALSAADVLLKTPARSAYALCRPPGHHAASDLYGGWCYLNNAAIAAARLSMFDTREGRYRNDQPHRVTILDIDYHHGNGTQEIFYKTANVQYVSIHADPELGGEPYFIGYREEGGEAGGAGFNYNIGLSPIGVTDERYQEAFHQALRHVREFAPEYLVVSLGLDGEEEDGVGSWNLTTALYTELGAGISALGLKTLIVQEGGYNLQTLGRNVVAFLRPFVTTETAAVLRP
jgi:acetoin utilization deacetylase AcuC-like enzyme